MIQNRLVSFLWPVFALTLGGMLLLAIIASFAHADPAAAGEWHPATAPAPELDLETRLAIWAAGLFAVGEVVYRFFQWRAPRTPALWDDELRDTLGAILSHVQQNSKPQQPRPPSSIAGVIVVSLLGAGLALQPACATAERAGGAAKVAALKCGEPQLATAAALIARWAVQDALAGKVDWASHETDALGFGLGIGTCAYAEVRRAWKAKPVVQALAGGPVPDDGQAGLERLRAKLGGVPIQLADGTVL